MRQAPKAKGPRRGTTIAPSKKVTMDPFLESASSFIGNIPDVKQFSLEEFRRSNLALDFNRIETGSNKRCLVLLSWLYNFVKNFKHTEISFQRDLDSALDECIRFLNNLPLFTEGMLSSVRVCKYFISRIEVGIETDFARDWLLSQLKEFTQMKLLHSADAIVEHGLALINEEDTIIIYSSSRVVRKLLRTAKEKGKRFSVIVVDNPPLSEGKQAVEELSKAGINCTLTLIGSLPCLLNSKQKIFVGASIISNNGMLVSRVGTSTLACIANHFRIPFIVFCETYKLSERSVLDSFALKSYGKSKVCSNISSISMRWDTTPFSFISMVITEIGKVPPSSIPVLIREFNKLKYVGNVQMPKNE